MAGFNKLRLIFGLFLIVVVAIGEIIFHHFQIPSWPAFMVMIFFILAERDPKKAPAILAGGLFGIALVVVGKFFVLALAGPLGTQLARLIFILVIVYAIVAFGEMLHILFNGYCFMFLVVTALARQFTVGDKIYFSEDYIWLWMLIELVGGAIFIAAIMGIQKIVIAIAMRGQKK